MKMMWAEHDPAICVEIPTASLFLERPDDVRAYQEILNGLDQVALTEGQSRSFLAELASEYDRMEEERHAGG